jgi:hypothetical protein
MRGSGRDVPGSGTPGPSESASASPSSPATTTTYRATRLLYLLTFDRGKSLMYKRRLEGRNLDATCPLWERNA